jgi:hypothetical protein
MVQRPFLHDQPQIRLSYNLRRGKLRHHHLSRGGRRRGR